MKKIISLKKTFSIILEPCSPYNFDTTIYRPSHFPFSDNEWEKGKNWLFIIFGRMFFGRGKRGI